MVRWKFSEKFRTQWIKVKFYKQKPKLNNAKMLTNVRFCEATREAVVQPVLLGRESICCPGAQYAFGWRKDYSSELMDVCQEKRQVEQKIIESMLSRMPRLENQFNYIGLNTDGEPDLVMSYIAPQEAMSLIKLYHNYKGRNLDVSLCSMMSICGGIAARTYLKKDISLSFGCADSRKYGDMRRENLAIGIPKRLFKMFID
jgi:uncharacterized protein (DUF169 family)